MSFGFWGLKYKAASLATSGRQEEFEHKIGQLHFIAYSHGKPKSSYIDGYINSFSFIYKPTKSFCSIYGKNFIFL